MSAYDVRCGADYLTHRPTLAEACGAARDEARSRPGKKVAVNDRDGTEVAHYTVNVRNGQLKAWVR